MMTTRFSIISGVSYCFIGKTAGGGYWSSRGGEFVPYMPADLSVPIGNIKSSLKLDTIAYDENNRKLESDLYHSLVKYTSKYQSMTFLRRWIFRDKLLVADCRNIIDDLVSRFLVTSEGMLDMEKNPIRIGEFSIMKTTYIMHFSLIDVVHKTESFLFHTGKANAEDHPFGVGLGPYSTYETDVDFYAIADGSQYQFKLRFDREARSRVSIA